MRGAAYEAIFIYCECAATKQIGLPGGEKRPKIIMIQKSVLSRIFPQEFNKIRNIWKTNGM